MCHACFPIRWNLSLMGTFSVTPGSRKKTTETPKFPTFLVGDFPETNSKLAPKTGCLEDEKVSFWDGYLPDRCVSGRVCLKIFPFFLADVMYFLCLKIWHHQKQNDQRHGANMFFWRSGRSRYELVVIWRNGALSSLTSSYGKLEIKEK